MTGLSVGKVLLRNVIRHTDAHNKIQEESEMWKLRVMEKQPPPLQLSCQKRRLTPHSTRGQMHCDRLVDESGDGLREASRKRARLSAQDERYWTQKLYEFEANDPDRWGHSGFKELYPEEFEDGTKQRPDAENVQRGKKRRKATLKTDKPRRSRKSKKKKKKRKKRKRAGGESGGDESGSESDGVRRRPKKRRHRRRSDRSRGLKWEGDGNAGREDMGSPGGGALRRPQAAGPKRSPGRAGGTGRHRTRRSRTRARRTEGP